MGVTSLKSSFKIEIIARIATFLAMAYILVVNQVKFFMMVLTYSITKGIGIGVLSYVIINAAIYFVDLVRYKLKKIDGRPKSKLSVVIVVVFLLFLIYFFVPTQFN